MKNKMILLAAFVIFSAVSGSAQERQSIKTKPKFQSINLAGVIEGTNGAAFQLETINGLKYKTWFIGLGAGLDHYEIRSVPLFLDIRKDLFTKSKTPFFYAGIGTNFPWQGQKQEWTTVKSYAGLFYDLGLGYTVPLKTTSIVFSAGYSLKKFSEELTTPRWCIWGDCGNQKQDNSYSLRRLSFKAGIQF